MPRSKLCKCLQATRVRTPQRKLEAQLFFFGDVEVGSGSTTEGDQFQNFIETYFPEVKTIKNAEHMNVKDFTEKKTARNPFSFGLPTFALNAYS